jgi:hypothetical protein
MASTRAVSESMRIWFRRARRNSKKKEADRFRLFFIP